MDRFARVFYQTKQGKPRILEKVPSVTQLREGETVYALVNGRMSSYIKYKNKLYNTPSSQVVSSNTGSTSGVEGVDVASTGATDGKVLTASGTNTADWEAVPSAGNPEGTDIISTGQTGGTKFLREDGDATCSWQTPPSGGGGSASMAPNWSSGWFTMEVSGTWASGDVVSKTHNLGTKSPLMYVTAKLTADQITNHTSNPAAFDVNSIYPITNFNGDTSFTSTPVFYCSVNLKFDTTSTLKIVGGNTVLFIVDNLELAASGRVYECEMNIHLWDLELGY